MRKETGAAKFPSPQLHPAFVRASIAPVALRRGGRVPSASNPLVSCCPMASPLVRPHRADQASLPCQFHDGEGTSAAGNARSRLLTAEGKAGRRARSEARADGGRSRGRAVRSRPAMRAETVTSICGEHAGAAGPKASGHAGTLEPETRADTIAPRHTKTPRGLDGNGCPAEAPYGCFLPDLTKFGTYRHPNPSNARGVFDYSSRLARLRPAPFRGRHMSPPRATCKSRATRKPRDSRDRFAARSGATGRTGLERHQRGMRSQRAPARERSAHRAPSLGVNGSMCRRQHPVRRPTTEAHARPKLLW